MRRSHALVLALLLGAAVIAAMFAVLTTTSLGMGASAAPVVSSAKIAARNAKLDKSETVLRRALKKKPPELPKLPQRITPQPRVIGVTAPAAPVSGAQPAAAPTQVSEATSEDDHQVDAEGGEDD